MALLTHFSAHEPTSIFGYGLPVALYIGYHFFNLGFNVK